MTMLRERQQVEVTETRHTIDWSVGLIGVVAAVVGVYFNYAPESWWLANLVEGWYLGMYVAACALLGGALALFARKTYVTDGGMSDRTVMTTFLAVIGFIAVVTFALIWIL